MEIFLQIVKCSGSSVVGPLCLRPQSPCAQSERAAQWPPGLLYAFQFIPLIPKMLRALRQEKATQICTAPPVGLTDSGFQHLWNPWQIPVCLDTLQQGSWWPPDRTWLHLSIWKWQRKRQLRLGCSTRITSIMLASRRISPSEMCNSARSWKWKHLDPFSLISHHILEFLQNAAWISIIWLTSGSLGYSSLMRAQHPGIS